MSFIQPFVSWLPLVHLLSFDVWSARHHTHTNTLSCYNENQKPCQACKKYMVNTCTVHAKHMKVCRSIFTTPIPNLGGGETHVHTCTKHAKSAWSGTSSLEKSSARQSHLYTYMYINFVCVKKKRKTALSMDCKNHILSTCG